MCWVFTVLALQKQNDSTQHCRLQGCQGNPVQSCSHAMLSLYFRPVLVHYSSTPESNGTRGSDAVSERAQLRTRCKQLEAGLYGLPEAVADIQALKGKVVALSKCRHGKKHTCVQAMSCMTLLCSCEMKLVLCSRTG